MAGRPSNSRKRLVEGCDVIRANSENLRVCRHVGIDTCATMPKPFESFRHCRFDTARTPIEARIETFEVCTPQRST
jgi:hypothetical protein